MNQARVATKQRNAFTLIELLVVIAIITILAAILFPVFASARQKARQSSCASNMRQIGIGIRMYSDDYDGEMPRTSHGSTSGSSVVWVLTLQPYIANAWQVRICPNDHRADREIVNYSPTSPLPQGTYGTSYILNEYVAVPQIILNSLTVRDGFTSLDELPRPADTIMVFEQSDEQNRGSYTDHTHSRSWFTPSNPQTRWGSILGEIEPDRHRVGTVPWEGVSASRRRFSFDRTDGVANYLYCDAHVKAIPAAKIRSWAFERFNFAKPPL